MLDTRAMAEILNVSVYDINNMVHYGVITPKRQGRGKAREYELLDLVCAKVALLMRDDGFNTDMIKNASKLIEENLKLDQDQEFGNININIDGQAYWVNSRIVKMTDEYEIIDIRHLPRHYYGVVAIARDMALEIDKLESEVHDEMK